MDEYVLPFFHTPCSMADVMADNVVTANNYLTEHHFKSDQTIPLNKTICVCLERGGREW